MAKRSLSRGVGIEGEQGVTPAAWRVTRRELDVIGLVACGCSNGEIADRLMISRRTVHQHLVNVMRKLGAVNRTELAVVAVVRGWVSGLGCVERVERRRRPVGVSSKE